MNDEGKLIECMEEIKAIAVSQQGKLTKEEIHNYLSDMVLDEKQLQAVYQYLSANQIVVEGYAGIPQEEVLAKESTDEDKKKIDKDSRPTKAQRNLQIYQQEVDELENISSEQEAEQFRLFLTGESLIRNQIMQGRLKDVIKIAQDYKKRNALIEDIIAEGNMGLLNAMAVLEQGKDIFLSDNGQPDMEKIHATIELEVKQAIEQMLDEMMEQKDWEDTVLAKTNLLHEAAKYMAEEMGRVATQEELSEYTKIPLEEIRDIMELSEDARKVAKP